MAFVYEVQFEISPNQLSELEIGKSLERVIGYLKTLLPSETGFITARGMHTVEYEDVVEVVFHSVWDHWEDLEQHRRSQLIEDKVLREFAPSIKIENLVTNIYDEVP